jgi:hypothetical protein
MQHSRVGWRRVRDGPTTGTPASGWIEFRYIFLDLVARILVGAFEFEVDLPTDKLSSRLPYTKYVDGKLVALEAHDIGHAFAGLLSVTKLDPDSSLQHCFSRMQAPSSPDGIRISARCRLHLRMSH